MPCYQCHEEFSFFKREHSCKNCGFSFCSSCLKKEITVPKINGVGKVCESCFKALSTGTDSQNHQGPRFTEDCVPENFKKRMAALEQKKNPRPAPYKRNAPITNQDSVEKRLENLRKERLQNVPSVEIIEERLSALRGQKSFEYASASNSRMPPTPFKSDEEQTMDLIKQQWDLNQIEAGGKSGSNDVPSHVLLGNKSEPTIDDLIQQAKHDVVDEESRKSKEKEDIKGIKDRLEKLRGDLKSDNPSTSSNLEELSEEEQVQMLIKKLSEEARMESSMDYDCSGVSSVTKASNEEEEEVLPWCCICSEDACIRCFDCDNDLFCRRCFKECHDGPDADHRTSGYRKPSKHTS